jgi:hypothetical protein
MLEVISIAIALKIEGISEDLAEKHLNGVSDKECWQGAVNVSRCSKQPTLRD